MSDDPTLQVAIDLRALIELHTHLGDEAAHSHDKALPGGDATVMLAGVSNLEAWGNHVDGAERYNDDPHRLGPPRDLTHLLDEDDLDQPPLQTLLFWSEQWRVEHGREIDTRPTVATEAAFLAGLLGWAWDNEAHFTDFAADVARARTKVENVLHDGQRDERVKTPCTYCPGVRLVRYYASVEHEDYWGCPRCRRRYDRPAYIQARASHLASDGADRFVRVQEVRSAVPKRQLTRWLAACQVLAFCDTPTHQVWLWWPDVRRLQRDADVAAKLRAAS